LLGADQDNLTPMVGGGDRHGVRAARWLADGVLSASRRSISWRAGCCAARRLACAGQRAVQAWRERMASTAGQALYRRRAAVIEWVNAGCRNRGLYAVNIRGAAKLRAVGLWHAMAHNMQCLWRVQVAAA
jgi:hypothetical protein